MKRFIPLAFASLAIPFLAMAQSSAPAPDEEKPVVPDAPVPAPETVVPGPPPVVPPAVPPAQPPAAVPPAVPAEQPPAAAPPEQPPAAVPAAADVPEKPAKRGVDRPSPPGVKRRGPPGAKDETGAPEDPVSAPARAAPEVDPKANAERAAPAPGRKMPPSRSAETRGTPPATPGTTGTRPLPGKRPADPQERRVDPSLTPAPAPGAPMPSVTTAPEVPAEPKTAERPERPEVPAEPKTAERPERPEVPAEPKTAERPERPVPQKPPSQETAKVLEDEEKRDRQADAAQARKIDNKEDAKRLLMNILGGGAAGVDTNDRPNQPRPRSGSRHGYRPSVEEVGRSQQDRERTVGSMVDRFQGRAPQAAPSGRLDRDHRSFETTEVERRTQFYEGNRRVVRYSSVQEIPPVIIASQQLNRVQVLPQAQSTYSVRPQAPQQGRYYNDIPPSYTTGDAYAVSYSVDPNSAISTDAILFRQGSTDFADAYSYDLVIDLAEAMKAPALSNETFVIEGHASAEGDYGQNLLLSQERAERISRELVRHGVSAERLMPVGYGEAEAAYPANASEADRRLDRRVVVFRMR